MKKRLISLLLTVLMVMSLFTGMSVSAYADDAIDSKYYKEYTLVQGDYILRVCQKLGINYYTVKDAIMALNNISNESGFRYLSVGKTVKIPVSDAAAVAIMTGKANGSTSGTTGTGTAANSSVAYYLIPYTMQRGETVLNVCNSLGIDFTKNADLIQGVNGIKSWNSVKAGSTILLPTTKTPAVGTTCYAVTGHKVVSGETTYTICQNNGINYNNSTKLLQALNPKTNFSSIKAGATMYLPITTTIKAQTGTTTGGSNNGSTGTTTDKNNTNTSTTTAKSYDIQANINTTYGTMHFYVNNKSVNSAKEGDVVTVDVTTKDGRAVDSVVVKYSDGRADVKLGANSFIMPACAVRVDANIKSGYDIKINSNYGFKTVAQVGGINVSSAAAGSSVKIASTDPSYAVKEVVAYYSTLFGMKKEVLSVNEQNCFVMPNKDVTVDVTLAPVTTHSFFRDDPKQGSFDIQVDGNSVSKAAKGAKVTVVWQAISGWDIEEIKVYKADKLGNYKDTDKINIYNNSFTMPDCPVYISVKFGCTTNLISLDAVEGGRLRAEVAGVLGATEATTDTNVIIRGEAKADGYVSEIKELTVVRKSDGHSVPVKDNGDGSFTFKMPAGGVNVYGKLKAELEHSVAVFFNAAGSENKVTVKAEGYDNWTVDDTMSDAQREAQYDVGTKLNLSTLARDNHAFTKFEIYKDGIAGSFDPEMTQMANSQGIVIMPNAKIAIKAYFSANEMQLPQAKVVGKGTVSYEVNGKSALSCKVGDTVSIVPISNNPHLVIKAEQISVIANDKNKTELKVTENGRGGYDFVMPADNVRITVTFKGQEHLLTMLTVDNTYGKNPTALQGQNLWGIAINTQTYNDTLYENNVNGTVVKINGGDAAALYMTDALKNKYNVEKVEMTSSTGKVHEGGVEYNQGSYRFFMADEDMTITVYLKEKTSKTHSLLDISYDAKKMTVGCTTDKSNGTVVSTANVGDIVFVKAQVQNTAAYMLKEDGITITMKTSDNIGAGKFTKGAINAEPTEAHKYYPQTDVNGNIIGWKYIMPEGGVKVSVAVQAKPYNINLTVTDTNGNDVNANGIKLAEAGYIAIVTSEAEVSNTRQVNGGKVENVGYGNAVKVQLTDTGAGLYTIQSIVVPGVEVKNNGFWMPANSVDLQIVLKEKNAAPNVITISKNVGSNGAVQFYTDNACTQLITDNKAAVGSVVYAQVTANSGYELDSFTAINVKDNTSIAGNEGNGKYSFTVPAEGLKVNASFKAKTYTLTVKYENAVHNGQVNIQVANGTVNRINAAEYTVTATYNSTVKFTIADTKLYTLVDAVTDVAVTSPSKNASSASFNMPASDVTVTLDLNSK